MNVFLAVIAFDHKTFGDISAMVAEFWLIYVSSRGVGGGLA